jgi:hypothetical protein
MIGTQWSQTRRTGQVPGSYGYARWLGRETGHSALGAGLRPRRKRRPQVSRNFGDIRSARWLGRETGHNDGKTGYSAGEIVI